LLEIKFKIKNPAARPQGMSAAGRTEMNTSGLLLNLREARVVIEDFRRDYNQDRPHSRLGYLSPNQWIEKQSSSPDSARTAGLATSRLESSENIN
jgi:transposase InsO family protein